MKKLNKRIAAVLGAGKKASGMAGLLLLLLTVSLAGVLTGCSGRQETSSDEDSIEDVSIENASIEDASAEEVPAKEIPAEETQAEEGLRVVCTIFPEYDWVRQILGDRAEETELTLLLDSGVDLHSYQPTAEDMVKIADCDLFLYVGGESDGWVEDALQEANNGEMVVINLLDVLGDTVREEELVEGMEGEEQEDHEGEGGEDAKGETGEESKEESEEEEVEYDEHVWLSLKNAHVICAYIAERLKVMDPANADSYAENAAAYLEALDALDAEYQDIVDTAAFHTLLFGDRFPFRYLVEDYGLNYYAAFVGCSAETEASFETIAFLAGKVDELGLTSVLTIEGAEHQIAETIIANTASKDQTIRVMDSMQSTTSEDVAKGTTYLSVMESNRDVLAAALN